MIDPLQLLPGLASLRSDSFPPNSRYAGVETATRESASGTAQIYLRRRFLPQPERFSLLRLHTVVQGDRLDNVTAQYLGDPEQFWRICDANRALRPDELTEQPENIGRTLRIALPEGLAGGTGG